MILHRFQTETDFGLSSLSHEGIDGRDEFFDISLRVHDPSPHRSLMFKTCPGRPPRASYSPLACRLLESTDDVLVAHLEGDTGVMSAFKMEATLTFEESGKPPESHSVHCRIILDTVSCSFETNHAAKLRAVMA